MESSCLNASSMSFPCPRVQELHKALQQRRAACLQQFITKIDWDVENQHKEYLAAKQMWDRSSDTPPIASELMQLMPQPETLEHDKFLMSMKELHQNCKDEALLKWYDAKRHWLQTDLDITKQHTEMLREGVQHLREKTIGGREVPSNFHNCPGRMEHIGDLRDMKRVYQELILEDRKRAEEELHLIKRKLPDAQAALQEEQQKDVELEAELEELRSRLQCEEALARNARTAVLQQQLKKSLLEKQVYAHTCVLHETTPSAVCLRLRGHVQLWVERASSTHSALVHVSAHYAPPTQHMDPCITMSPELSWGLVACAWCRIVATVNASSMDEELRLVFAAGPGKSFDATVSCQELPRFLRLFDIEIVRIVDLLRTMRNISKDVPEVAQFSAQFKNSPEGDQPSASLKVLLSVLHTHSVEAGGVLVPIATQAEAGKFNAVQCIFEFNANLAALPTVTWSDPVVTPVLGHIDAEHALQASQTAAPHSSLSELLRVVVQSLKRAL